MSVDDARNRVGRFAQGAQQQAQSLASREREWTEYLCTLEPAAQSVVDELKRAGVEDLYVDRYRNALVVWFGSRPYAVQQTSSGYRADAAEGATLMFIIGDDGQVRAMRRPYFPESNRPEYQTTATFAHPNDLTQDVVANVTAEFLEWVVGGQGTGGLPIRFF